MPAKDQFEVLLSTYNGMQYLQEQLSSIESQTVSGVRLHIRDDGSTDGTTCFLETYSSQREWVSFYRGENLGVVNSFMWLLNALGEGTEWVAFCDQDDVWDDNKLQRAKNCLKDISGDVPAIYFSSVRLVDESKNLIGVTSPCQRNPGFLNALVQNVATGCTVVLNRSAFKLISGRNVDGDKVGMHDRWCYLVISAFGEVVCDKTPTMDYRQHMNNVIGSKTGWAQWAKRVGRLRKRRETQLVDHVKELIRVYGNELDPDKRKICDDFIKKAGSESIITRCRYAWAAPVYRQNVLDDLLMRIMIGLGWR